MDFAPLLAEPHNLRRAIDCYQAALRVRTEADSPADWAMTQFNLGLGLKELGMLDESVQAFVSAVRGYESVGDQIQADEAKAAADRSRACRVRKPRRDEGTSARRAGQAVGRRRRESRSDHPLPGDPLPPDQLLGYRPDCR